jgi:glycosyltransferase involved in cell wall biosynthesis
MKIVYLSPSGRLGGAEALLLDLVASIRKARPGWDLDLILPEDGIVAHRAAALGAGVHVLPMPRAISRLGDSGMGRRWRKLFLAWRILMAVPAGLMYRRTLRRKIARLKPDVLHSNGFKMHFFGVWSRQPGTPVVWHVHDFVSSRPVMARLLPHFASDCSAAIANSEHVSKDLRLLCPKLPVTTVLNAVDLEEFSPSGPVCDLDSLAGLPAAENVIRIGLVATMARWKGHAVFLEALSKMSGNIPVRAYIIGGGIYLSDGSQWQGDELRRVAERFGVAGRVGFTGFVARPAEAIRALDIVVHASTEPEPFGLAIAEAMACGRAVICSGLGGPREFLRDGVNGLTHEAGNSDDLARKIESLSGNSAYRTELGRAARESAVRMFDRRRLALEMIPVYESITTCLPMVPNSFASTARL